MNSLIYKNEAMRGLYPMGSNDESAWIVGWGTTVQNGIPPFMLRNARIKLLNNSLCNNVLPLKEKNWKSQLCAGELDGSRDTCQGDSGGSIYTKVLINGVAKYMSAGIVSYGDGNY
jgi:secreted trypsin-like serine protease